MSRCIYCGREAHVLSPTAGGMVCKRCDPLRQSRRRNAGLRAWYRGIDAASIIVIATVITLLVYLVLRGRGDAIQGASDNINLIVLEEVAKPEAEIEPEPEKSEPKSMGKINLHSLHVVRCEAKR